MIKIRIRGVEFSLNGNVWSGELPGLVEILNLQTHMRPFRYERREEGAIARYIVEKHKDREAEIIYDSEEGKEEERTAPYD